MYTFWTRKKSWASLNCTEFPFEPQVLIVGQSSASRGTWFAVNFGSLRILLPTSDWKDSNFDSREALIHQASALYMRTGMTQDSTRLRDEIGFNTHNYSVAQSAALHKIWAWVGGDFDCSWKLWWKPYQLATRGKTTNVSTRTSTAAKKGLLHLHFGWGCKLDRGPCVCWCYMERDCSPCASKWYSSYGTAESMCLPLLWQNSVW